MITSAIAVTNEQDIMAIYDIVSPELQSQIREAFPHLFKPKVFDFTRLKNDLDALSLPFMVGLGLVDKKDKNKCLVVNSGYKIEVDKASNGFTVIRFFEKQF